MAVLDTRTKAKVGWRTAKAGAKRPSAVRAVVPPAIRITFKGGKPFAKRRVRQEAERLGETARAVGDALSSIPEAARELGLMEPPPKPKRTAPRVAAGVVIGATAVYFLEPGVGAEHRKQVLRLVS
jgi:hypothetical protein